MKRIAIFVGLKVLEIVGIGVFFGLGVYFLNMINFPTPKQGGFWRWPVGIWVFLSAGYLICCIPFWVKANWCKAGELAGRGEK